MKLSGLFSWILISFSISAFSQEMLFDNSQLDSPGPESDLVSRAQIYGDPALAGEIYPGGSSYDDDGYAEYGLPGREVPTVEVQASENDAANASGSGDPQENVPDATPDGGEDGTAEIGPYDGESPEEMQNPPPGSIPADEGSPADLASEGGEATLGSGEANRSSGNGTEEQETPAEQGTRNDAGTGKAAPGGAAGTGIPERQSQPGILPDREGSLYHAADLLQARVVDGSGNSVGAVTDIVLNVSGRIEYYAMRLENYENLRSGGYLVPFDMAAVEPSDPRPVIRLEPADPVRDLIFVTNDLQVRQTVGPRSVLYTGLMRYRIVNFDGESIGAIEDLVIDAERSEVVYAAFAPAGNLGSGGRLIAMPFRDLTYDVESRTVRIDAGAGELERARTFSPDEWPAEAASNWRPYF